MTPDIINGLFESLGSLFISFSVWKLMKQKIVSGVSWVHISFFSFWGIWNLYYYPSLGQWLSFVGGVMIVVANTIYMFLLLYYSKYPGGNRKQ